MKDQDEKIEVFYSCDECDIHDERALVSARRDGEEILVWMKVLQHSLAADHVRRSPECSAEYLNEVRTPVGNDAPIGGNPRLN